jgi:broad specificity phosphatase PhoE
MRVIEVRRNSVRAKPAKGLSETGVELARAVAPYLGGAYHAYYTSPTRRCRETLESLGFPTFRRVKVLGPLPDAFDRFEQDLLAQQLRTGCGFLAGYMTIPAARELLMKVGARVLKTVRRIARKIPSGGRALVISHSGVIEATGMAARGTEDSSFLLPELGHLEGIVIELVDDVVRQVRVLRLPGDVRVPHALSGGSAGRA